MINPTTISVDIRLLINLLLSLIVGWWFAVVEKFCSGISPP
jgi:hypothetical protein